MIGFWLIIIITSLAVSALATALILLLAGARGTGQKPYHQSGRGNSANKLSVPLSGIILVPVALMSTLLSLGIGTFWNAEAVKTALTTSASDPFFLVCALMVIYLVGLCKDLSRVGESADLITQVICTALVILSGMRIASLQGLFSIGEIPSMAAIVITVGVILASVNATGLTVRTLVAGKGICSLILLYYGVAFFLQRDYLFATVTAGLLASNIIGGNLNQKNPLLRLGYTGELTIGLLFSIMAIRLCQGPGLGQSTLPQSAPAQIPEIPTPTDLCNPVILGLAPIVILLILEVYCSIIQVKNNKPTSDQ